MVSRKLRFFLIAMLTLVTAAGCDSVGEIAAPLNDSAFDPQFAPGEGKGKGNAPGQEKKNGLKAVTVNVSANGVMEFKAGPQGGRFVSSSGYVSLTIPKGVVPAQTTFRIALSVGPHVSIEATATSGRSRTPNDVGSRGFSTPLTLELYTFGATGHSLQVALEQQDGTLKGVPSVLDGDFIVAEIAHFSRYFISDYHMPE